MDLYQGRRNKGYLPVANSAYPHCSPEELQGTVEIGESHLGTTADDPITIAQDELAPSTRALARRVVRKIDLRILVIMFVTYNLNFIDKAILSSAAVFGLEEDNHLHGSQYSWVGSIFYFGYLIWEYPTTVLIQRLPVSKYLSGVTFVWGAIVAVTAACSSFGGLATCRFLLGMAESTVSPSFVYITSTWYTRDEVPSRTGIWFAGNSLGGFIASICAYGIGHIDHPLHPWQWLFIIFGVITSVWSFVIFLCLPSTINDATFLTDEEKQYAEDRVVLAGTGRYDSITSEWKRQQVIECFLDPKTYFIIAMSVLTQIPNGGTGSFANLALKAFGFTSLQTTLIGLPSSVISILTITGTGWLAGRHRNIATYLIVAAVIPPIVGSAIIYKAHGKGVRLFAYYCLQTGPACIPLLLGLISANYKGITKKMTITAILFVTYCAGNIAGPHTFLTSEAKQGYPTAFGAIMSCYSLVVVFALGLRVHLIIVNRHRDRVEGVVDINAEIDAKRVLTDEDYEDITDFNTPGFRYRI